MEFRYNVRDLQFILKEWLPMEEVFSCDRFRGKYALEDVDMYLSEGYKIAREILNPLNAEGDRIGAVFNGGTVVSPPGYREAYKFLQANGWGSSSECADLESTMPLTLYKAIFEMNSAACPALMSYIKLTSGAANLLIKFAGERERALFLPKMLSGDWQGTMCITEPNAGSDVGDAITRAIPTEDPRIYKIQGTKMFITGGDAGICENTIHMVLARPEGGAPGSAGLGLYIVPKFRVNEDGSLGEFNDVVTAGIEHKMGLRAHATALLNFGENDECCGIMVGPPPDARGRSQGLAMMFNMMNESRIGTGHNSNSQAAAAYAFASRYATERIQGRPFGEAKGGRVPIIRHEDVRRMLLDMKAVTEGVRAMIFRGFYCLDIAEHSPDREKARHYADMAAILTPLIKGYGSEATLGIIATAMQVLGGVGYTREYPIEQYLRDSKILTIWEGTTFIHGNDLVGRKMTMNGGSSFSGWMRGIREFAASHAGAASFAAETGMLLRGCDCLEGIKGSYDLWYGDLDNKRQFIPLNAVRALMVCAQVQIAECLLEQAFIAARRLEELPESHFDRSFYEGKIASARHYVRNILPAIFVRYENIKSEDRTCLDCSEEMLVVV
ncbi:MAG: acyl-CoA dehydrogenase [Syntrophobacterales bacterium]|nr:acyl-CoA dehydrogenase [Syntrophobacterales bacterium]